MDCLLLCKNISNPYLLKAGVVSKYPFQLKLFVFAVVCALILTSCGKKKGMSAAAIAMMQAVPVRAVVALASDVPLDVSERVAAH